MVCWGLSGNSSTLPSGDKVSAADSLSVPPKMAAGVEIGLDELSSVKVVASVTILASDGRVIFVLLLLLLSTPGALTTVLFLFMFMSDALTTVLLFTSGALTSASLFSASSIPPSFCPFSPCILNTSTCCLHRILGCSPSRDSLIGIAVGGGGYVFAGGGDHGFCFVLASLEEQFQLRHHLSKSFRELLGDALVNGLEIWWTESRLPTHHIFFSSTFFFF